MVLKVIQINIWKGKFLPQLVRFLRSEDPDIVFLQEVTAKRENLSPDKNLVIFDYLKNKLGLEGEVVPTFGLVEDEGSYQGNAVLTKGKVLGKEVVWLRGYNKVVLEEKERDYPLVGRNALSLLLDLNGLRLHAISAHLAWTAKPKVTQEKLRQAKVFANYLESLEEPFVLGTDANIPPQSAVIKIIEGAAKNLVVGSGIGNTLNPKVHKVFESMPEGLLVDYIFASKHFRVEKIEAPQVNVSDHLPVVATLLHQW